MTVIFQDKIIYMPYMPPFTRSERIEDYAEPCKPVQWSPRSIQSLDGVKLSLCVGEMVRQGTDGCNVKRRRMILCYFHGNGGSLPPRLPMLSNVLKAVLAHTSGINIDITLVALSYRGYWTSSGRATERGIRKDAQAMLHWIASVYESDAEIVLWGQSIGAGVACTAAADAAPTLQLSAMILETPFTSVKSMLIALYPQKWLPYQYLWPFLWNHWDTPSALRSIASSKAKAPVLLLVAKRDEVVPPEEADKIQSTLSENGFAAQRVDIFGSLHTEATTRREGQGAVAQFLSRIVKQSNPTRRNLGTPG